MTNDDYALYLECEERDMSILRERANIREGDGLNAYYHQNRKERIAYQESRYQQKREELIAYQKRRYEQKKEYLRAYQRARYYRMKLNSGTTVTRSSGADAT